MKNSPNLSFILLPGLLLSGCGDDPTSPTVVDFIDLRIEEVSSARAVVRFETSEPTTCEAEFGVDADALDQRATDPSMEPDAYSVDHEVFLEDLAPSTNYFVRARAELPSGEVSYSDTYEFTTAMAVAVDSLINYALATRGGTIGGVSSNFGGGTNDSFWGANNAIDGQMSTEWSSNGDGNNAWILIDFGQRRRLTHFEFRSRQMPDGTAITTSIQVQFGDSEPLGPFATPEPEQVYRFELGSIEAESVRLDILTSTGGNTGIREVRFLGR